MKKLFAAAFFAIGVFHLTAQNINFSGLLDSSVSFRTTKGEIFLGIEEYANFRMQAKLRERATIYGAVNLIAAAGDYAAAANAAANSPSVNPSAFAGNENYFAAIELERLYFRLNFEAADLDGGLMRLPFGYGQIWGPSDFLNPKNPLIPDARPRAILGAALSWYPPTADELKLLGFGTAPRDPFLQGAKGWLAGISMDRHFDTASVQALYSFETPKDGSANGIHRAGVSLKADIKASFVIDALYTYNHEAGTGLDGLSFSAGADYSYFDGKLIVLAEYLYNGEASSTSSKDDFPNRHYLYAGGTWAFSDYTNMTAAFIFSFDDFSFTPFITLNHDLFQGAVLTITAQLPMNNNTFSHNGSLTFNCSAKLRFRF